METCEIETFPGNQHFKNLRFEDCKAPGRKRKVLAGIARAVKAVLQTASESEEDWIAMWKELKVSELVENELCVEAEMSAELRAHAQLWNDATVYAPRIQISAILNECYKFSAVNRFNKKPEASIAGEEATEIDVSKLETNGLYFDPPITPYIWKQGGLHAKNGALSEVIREDIVRWKYDLSCVQSIQAFVNHPDVTQRVAYGTRWVDNPYGGQTEVANVIRTIPNALLSRQIHDHLKAQQPPGNIPTKRTICTMLDNMPASKTRSLEGICPAHESCSRSFDDISNVLDSLKVYPGFRDLVSPDDVKCLSKAIVDARIYTKNIYRHEIKNHSEIKVRLSCYLRFTFPKKICSLFGALTLLFL
jgi:hypothetical protein